MIIAAFFVADMSSVMAAPASEVPVALRAAIFSKILQSTPKLHEQGIRLLTVFDSDQLPHIPALRTAFEELGISAKFVAVENLDTELTWATAVYVFSLQRSKNIGEITRSKGLLSLSSHKVAVTSGQISVGVILNKNRPQIVVHLPKLRSEGYDLPAKLLKLAIIFR